MKTKILSVILSGLLLTSVTPQLYTGAVEENVEENVVTTMSIKPSDSVDAVGLISSCAILCTAGTKCVYLSAEVYGTQKLAKIGFKNIKIQRSSDQYNWTTETTIPDQISEDVYHKLLTDYKVSVKGGYYYRIVLDNYAKEDTWWFPKTQTAEAISNVVWVS